MLLVLIVASIVPQYIEGQIKEVIESDNDFILPKFPYSKTNRIAKIYCGLYSDKFICSNIGVSERGMFPEDFTLADQFFVKLMVRPVGMANYNALNIAGLYLRSKRPGENDTTYAHTYLDIELEFLVDRIYFYNDELEASQENVVEFKLAFLSLMEENLFLISDKIYDSELIACNNFEGIYYESSRRYFADVLYSLLEKEKNSEVLEEINLLISKLPEKYKISEKD